MRFTSIAAFLAAFATFSNAAPTSKAILHEKRDQPLSRYVRGARADAQAVLPIRIGLTQTNLDEESVYAKLMDVAHPASPNFGKHWSAADVHGAFAPTEETMESVKAWLVAAGIASERIRHYENRAWLAFEGTVAEAEALFKTEYYEHAHTSRNELRVGCDSYHVPEHLTRHIDYVTPGVKLSAPLKKSVVKRDGRNWGPWSGPSGPWQGSRPGPRPGPSFAPVAPSAGPPHWNPPQMTLPEDLRTCGANITPACIRALYDIPFGHFNVSNALAVYEQGDYYDQADLDMFYASYAPNVPQGTGPVLKGVDGGFAPVAQNSSLATGESIIDFDLVFSLTYPQQVILYQTDDQIYEPEEVATVNTFNTLLDALDGSYCNYTAYDITGDSTPPDPVYPDPAAGGYKGQLQCGVYKPANVISLSYGEAEQDVPANYAKRQCNEFLKLGLQGVSFFFASGDYGVASFPGDGGPNGCLENGTVFNPQYPSGCPYLTSVGATRLYPNQTIYDRESVMHANLSGTAQNFSSAGGFSNYFTPAPYQQQTLNNYFAQHNPQYPYYTNGDIGANGGIYNRNGRGIPDVSANGALLLAYVNGDLGHWYGSSLAAPIWASTITLINNERHVRGKGPVGFINPTLYENPWLLNDIINGTNPGCGTEGFGASEGWDPATGLGTPNYDRLLGFYLRLP